MSDPLGKYRVFLAVSEAGSVSEAARRLFISQPAVSADIASLEATLGVCLFIRSRHGVRLTEAGSILLEHVKSAFSLLDAGRRRLRELADLEGGSLCIGASDMTLRFFLLDHIAAFHRAHPGIRLTVTNAPTPRTLAALASGTIDFGVISGPLSSTPEGLTLLPVRTVQDIVVASPSHPLAGVRAVTREMLAAHPMLMLEGNTSTRAYLEGWLGRDFPPPAIELATTDLLLEFVKRGLGIAGVVGDFAKAALASGELVALDLSEPPAPRPLYLVYSSRLPLSAAARRFLTMLVGEDML